MWTAEVLLAGNAPIAVAVVRHVGCTLLGSACVEMCSSLLGCCCWTWLCLVEPVAYAIGSTVTCVRTTRHAEQAACCVRGSAKHAAVSWCGTRRVVCCTCFDQSGRTTLFEVSVQMIRVMHACPLRASDGAIRAVTVD
ncbi:hypothetical protein COO60DRAFT_362910 [Scenedesmus sp. NREL 46B-D3]|nr:hypothetical protein COO60DRAFT_362910 [Scenedesmus sp. NREL 46B-D3]